MDTTETYIKMCEKATEIQKDTPQEVGGSSKGFALGGLIFLSQREREGDYFWVHDREMIDICEACGHKHSYHVEDKVVWLPRQDQLQEMVMRENCSEDIKDGAFLTTCLMVDWYKESGFTQSGWFSSMEQLWLAFVMKEKYNKVWNGSEWLTPDSQPNLF